MVSALYPQKAASIENAIVVQKHIYTTFTASSLPTGSTNLAVPRNLISYQTYIYSHLVKADSIWNAFIQQTTYTYPYSKPKAEPQMAQ